MTDHHHLVNSPNELKQFIKQDNVVLCLLAPTASGKTDFAYRLYETGRFELISVDSALIYQGMNIGSAKPNADELARYPHHLVDIIPPTESYSVADFVQDVKSLIEQIHQRGKLPLLVGGTMMYYMALFDGISAVPESNPDVRRHLAQRLQTKGMADLYQYLQAIDPITAKKLNATDSQRITRAIEVYEQTGKPISYWQQLPKIALANNPNQAWLGLVVIPERPWLHTRIEQRLEQMWQKGLIFEVMTLIDKHSLQIDMPSMRCVGYRQALAGLIQLGLVKSEQGKLSVTATDITAKLTQIQWFLTHLPTDQHLTKTQLSKLLNLYQNQHESAQSAKNLPINTIDDLLACQDMKNKALYATRQLAKRQYTWLNKMMALQNESSINLGIKKLLAFTSISQIQQKLD